MKVKAAKHITILLLNIVCLTTLGQVDALFSQYMFNGLVLNPAYAGSRGALSITADHRNQWAGIAGAPKSLTLSAHSPLRNDRYGLGLLVYNKTAGVIRQSGMFGTYAFRIPLLTGNLALGLQAGLTSFSANWTEETTVDPGDPAFSYNSETTWLPNFGFGFQYQTKRFYLGASVPRLLANFDKPGSITNDPGAYRYRYYFVNTSYVWSVFHELKIKPTLLVKYIPGITPQIDLNLNFLSFESFWFGMGYRSGKTLILLTEYQWQDQLSIGYSYDLLSKELGPYSSGSHEIMVRYEFNRSKSATKSPRYF